MNDQTDSQLLRAYAERRSEPAFGELVQRHVGLVYSAARRMVCDAHLAEDVTQGVFLALANNAGDLKDRPVLSGWLHRTAQNIAAQTVRTDVRRRVLEQQAATMNLLLSAESETSWERVAPHLDAALSELSESDRDALMLRYFEKKTASEMAGILGISDEAAQKRVCRAVEHLRNFFAKHGVTAGASGLVVLISANAVQAAPAGLAANITAAALSGTIITTTAVIAATKAIAMTALQKALLSSIVVASVVAPLVVQLRAQARLHVQEDAVRQQVDQLANLQTQNGLLSNVLAQANKPAMLSESQQLELLRLRAEVGRLRIDAQELAQSKAGNSASGKMLLASTEKLWAARVDQLQEWLEGHPSEKILELQFLTDHDWVNSIYPHAFEAPEEYRQAMSTVRANAESRIMNKLHAAFRRYARANNGQLPTDLSQLKSYLDSPIDDAILQRYEIVAATNLVRELQAHGDWVITQKAPVNEALDVRQALGLDTGGMADCRVTNRWTSAR